MSLTHCPHCYAALSSRAPKPGPEPESLDLDTSAMSDAELRAYYKRTSAARHLRSTLAWRDWASPEWRARFEALGQLSSAQYHKAYARLDEAYANRDRPEPTAYEAAYWATEVPSRLSDYAVSYGRPVGTEQNLCRTMRHPIAEKGIDFAELHSRGGRRSEAVR